MTNLIRDATGRLLWTARFEGSDGFACEMRRATEDTARAVFEAGPPAAFAHWSTYERAVLVAPDGSVLEERKNR